MGLKGYRQREQSVSGLRFLCYLLLKYLGFLYKISGITPYTIENT
jgi:hypothetical protein